MAATVRPAPTAVSAPESVILMLALEMLEHERVGFVPPERQPEPTDGHVNRIAERRDALNDKRRASCQAHR